MRRIYRDLLPLWLQKLEATEPMISEEAMMSFAISIAKRNVVEQSGGPFGAALFDEDGCLVAVGVNRVLPLQSAFFHAEIVCLFGALERVKSYALPSSHIYTLASSSQPCAMCMGAIIWAGIRNLLTAAKTTDATEILGFDEGPIHPNWKEEYQKRGIEVREDILRAEACDVLKLYVEQGGTVYNPK
ncbi:MAG: nucleoside deaminase [SAR324 cluster bacterium]|uniref:Nucleoside deaminase n=1 Tax=SAR324 cluster bacterium TaxID=2024889 RepID=A0A7X9IL21_9DELT|nr:nucleoside deaminase [SAR324 cluster bacterium]